MRSVEASPASTTRSHRSRLEPRGPPVFGPLHYLHQQEQEERQRQRQQEQKLKNDQAVPRVGKRCRSCRFFVLSFIVISVLSFGMSLWVKGTDRTLSPVSFPSALGVVKATNILPQSFSWFNVSFYSAMGGAMTVWENTFAQWQLSASPSLWWSQSKNVVAFVLKNMQYVLHMLWELAIASGKRADFVIRAYLLPFSHYLVQRSSTFRRDVTRAISHFSVGSMQYENFLVSPLSKARSLLLGGGASVIDTVKSWLCVARATLFPQSEKLMIDNYPSPSSDSTTSTPTTLAAETQSCVKRTSSRQNYPMSSTLSALNEPWSSAAEAREQERKKKEEQFGKPSPLWHLFSNGPPLFTSKNKKEVTNTEKQTTAVVARIDVNNNNEHRSFFLLLRAIFVQLFSPATSHQPIKRAKDEEKDKAVGDQNISLHPEINSSTINKITPLSNHYSIMFDDESCIKLYKQGGRAESRFVHDYFVEDLTHLLRLYSWTTVYNVRMYCVGNKLNVHFKLLQTSGEKWTQEKFDAIVKAYEFPLLRAVCRKKMAEMFPTTNGAARIPEPVQIVDSEQERKHPEEPHPREEQPIEEGARIPEPVRIVDSEQERKHPEEPHPREEQPIEEGARIPEPVRIVDSEQERKHPEEPHPREEQPIEEGARIPEPVRIVDSEQERKHPEEPHPREEQPVEEGARIPEPVRIVDSEQERKHPEEPHPREEQPVEEGARIPEPVRIVDSEQERKHPEEPHPREEQPIEEGARIPEPVRIVDSEQERKHPEEPHPREEQPIEEGARIPEPAQTAKSEEDEEVAEEQQKPSDEEMRTEETLEDSNVEHEQFREQEHFHERQRQQQQQNKQESIVCDERLRVAALEHESSHLSVVKRLLMLSESELTAEARELYEEKSFTLEIMATTPGATVNTTVATERISRGVYVLICTVILVLVAVVCGVFMVFQACSTKLCCNCCNGEKDLSKVVVSLGPAMLRWNSALDSLLFDALDARCFVFFTAATASVSSYFSDISEARSVTLQWYNKCLANVLDAYFQTCEMHYVDLLTAISLREGLEEELLIKDALHMSALKELEQEHHFEKLLLQEGEERAALQLTEKEEVTDMWKDMVAALQVQLQHNYYKEQQGKAKEVENKRITGAKEGTSDVITTTASIEDAVMEKGVKSQNGDNDEQSGSQSEYINSSSSSNSNDVTDLEKLLRDMLLKENREKHALILELRLLRHQLQHQQERGIVREGTSLTGRAASLPVIHMDYKNWAIDSDNSDEVQGKCMSMTRETDREREYKLSVSPTSPTSTAAKSKASVSTRAPQDTCITATGVSGLVQDPSEVYNRILQPQQRRIQCVSPSRYSSSPLLEAVEDHSSVVEDNKHFPQSHTALIESPLIHPAQSSFNMHDDAESNVTVSRELVLPEGNRPRSTAKLTYPVTASTPISSRSTVSTDNTVNETRTTEGVVVGEPPLPISTTITTRRRRRNLDTTSTSSVTMRRRSHDTHRYHGNDWSDLQGEGSS
ncbi:hypothetical protein LSM04_001943 [Trypanosoma melophagium]|uniref:uncharacterized protein n=1 Tax=Trypanosoma melophagium TaxID=715481 RepID=UPI003519EB06|nr:hypothetical protein LSM04_001943 [Trypanosoma melophagium]